jgi:hypothetical protein
MAKSLRAADVEVVIEGFTASVDNEITQRFRSLRVDRSRMADLQSTWQFEHIDPLALQLGRMAERRTALLKQRDALVSAKPAGDPAEIDALLNSLGDDMTALETLRAGRLHVVDMAVRLGAAIDQFLLAASAIPASGAVSPIVGAAILHEFFSGGRQRYVLLVDPAFGGGESQYEEKVGRDRAQHVGGVVLAYMLTDKDGLIRSSGNVASVATSSLKVGEDNFAWRKEVLI